MDEHWRHQRDAWIIQLKALDRRGQQITETRAIDAMPAWQRDCAAAISQLSGGSKTHWLSRAFSNALLVRSTTGAVVVEADAMEIVDRIRGVLAEGMTSLTGLHAAASHEPPQPRLFEFVENTGLRPVLEQAFANSRAALDRGEFGLALVLSCSLIESLITDALTHAAPTDTNGPHIASWSFEKRIAEAERGGLIRGGCARLPPIARKYRDLTDADGELRAGTSVSERDAKLAGQVLRVVMRDLNPGR